MEGKTSKALITITLGTLLITQGVFGAQLEVTKKESATTAVEQSITELGELRDNDINSNTKNTTELSITKKTLERVLDLSLEETTKLRGTLEKTPLETLVATDYTFDVVQHYDILSHFLDYSEAYWKDTKKAVGSLTNIKDIQMLAKNITEWRTKVYEPSTTTLLDTYLVTNNKVMLKKTRDRFEKISNELRRLQNAQRINRSSIEPIIAGATGALKTAEALNADSTLLLFSIIGRNPLGITEHDNSDDIHRRIRNLVEQSTNKLQATYKKFLELSDAVRKQLQK